MAKATELERHFVTLINEARAARGLAPLQIEMNLNLAADRHSEWMAANGVLDHSGAGGSTPTERMVDAGFDLVAPWKTAENIGYHSIDGDGSLLDEVTALHKTLMDSPGHYANIINADVGYIGLGLATGTVRGYTVLFVTQNFAATAGTVDLDLPEGVAPSPVVEWPEIDLPDLSLDLITRAEWNAAFDGITVPGSALADNVAGTDLADDFGTSGGNDKAWGRGGNDWMNGGDGHDTLRGGVGNDMLIGLAGDDLLVGGDGQDTIDGSGGADRIFGGAGSDVVIGQIGNETLRGGDGQDTMLGGDGNDLFAGQGGDDWMIGGAGNDTLYGHNGANTHDGGAGADVLVGGAHGDSFIFRAGNVDDIVSRYQPGVDRLLIDKDLVPDDLVGFFRDGIEFEGMAVRIDFGNGNAIRVFGYNDLTSIDQVLDDILLF